MKYLNKASYLSITLKLFLTNAYFPEKLRNYENAELVNETYFDKVFLHSQTISAQ